MIIRKFEAKDAIGVCDLIKRNDLEISSEFYPKEVITSWLIEITPEIILRKSKQRACFIAEEDRRIIGHISLYEEEIKKLHVLPEFHRKGVGKGLVERVEETARHISQVRLIVYSSIYAEPFYESCGFKSIRDEWREIDSIKWRLIYMEKELTT
jgi:GNAT superfamily N-acetyltransferase